MNALPELIFLKTLNQGNIAIMGGSFNPPHLGHLYISEKILQKMQLNLLIWLITPLNPFKKTHSILPLEKREQLCKSLIKNNLKIKTSILEKYLNNNYTLNTLKYLRSIINPNVNIFWIMGEDLLYTFHNFYKWKDIVNLVNIVVVSRGGNSTFLSLNQKFPQIMKNYGTYYNNYNIINKYILNNLPKWYFLNIPKMDLSSTQIRNKSIKYNE